MASRKLLVNLTKFAVSGAILTWVVYKAQQDQSFVELRQQPKHWGHLGVAFLLALAALALSFVRWWGLVRALNLPFRMRDAFRLSFLGYLFNFVSVGSVGGDLFKAVFIAREQHGHRAEAVASVVVDRAVGLYCLVLVAAVGVSATPLPDATRPIVDGVLLVAAVGAVGIAAWLAPITGRLLTPARFHNWPMVGLILARLIAAIDMYRRKLGSLALAAALSVVTHILTTISFYSIALALPGSPPSLAEHFAIVPLANTTGALPLPMGALGALEGVMNYLYRAMAGSHEGLLVCFGYRIITILLALVGAVYYIGSRREVVAAIHEAEDVERAEEEAGASAAGVD